MDDPKPDSEEEWDETRERLQALAQAAGAPASALLRRPKPWLKAWLNNPAAMRTSEAYEALQESWVGDLTKPVAGAEWCFDRYHKRDMPLDPLKVRRVARAKVCTWRRDPGDTPPSKAAFPDGEAYEDALHDYETFHHELEYHACCLLGQAPATSRFFSRGKHGEWVVRPECTVAHQDKLEQERHAQRCARIAEIEKLLEEMGCAEEGLLVEKQAT